MILALLLRFGDATCRPRLVRALLREQKEGTNRLQAQRSICSCSGAISATTGESAVCQDSLTATVTAPAAATDQFPVGLNTGPD